MRKSDIGLIGLAVMGENLAMNMESKGFSVSVFNRTVEKVNDFMSGRAAGKRFYGATSLEDLASSLKTPRLVMLMVRAGKPVDDFIDKLIPLMEKGDVIIDGGNSNFEDTRRRAAYVESQGLYYIGVGVSGGEEGALKGPSMMPGGSREAWKYVEKVFKSICAHVDGEPCCEWVGSNGAGHYVKMVHNGIEYGDMQLICEAYQLMRSLLGMTPGEIGEVFDRWNKGKLDSYLIEITSNILKAKDSDGQPIIDKILDTAGQKGTGKWAGIEALNEAVPLTLIAEAVFARCLSADKDARVKASRVLSGAKADFAGERDVFIGQIEKALYAAKIISYAQGFALMRAAAKTYDWRLNYGDIALMWRGGCIIRSVFLGKIKEAFDADADLGHLLMDGYFAGEISGCQTALRQAVSQAVLNGVAVPAMASAVSYYDGFRSENLPSNLLQAQRDYFGAHTFERVDAPRGEFFHFDWLGEGASTVSSAYNA